MAKLGKERIEETSRRYDSAVIVDTGDPVWDKELKMVIHGSPVIDGRVRFNTQTFAIYNPMKTEMVKLFKPIYNSDEVLQGVIIDKLMIITTKLYFMPTADMAKHMTMSEINSEEFPSIVVKDNDNAEKVHFDVLHDKAFRVILDDNLIWYNDTKKFISMNERVELSIKFCSTNNNVHAMYDRVIRKNTKYIFMKLHPKFIRIHQVLDLDDVLGFHVYLLKHKVHYKLDKVKTYRKALRNLLDFYPKELYIAIMLKMGVKQKIIDGLKVKEKIIEYYIDQLMKDNPTNYNNYNFLDKIVEGGLNKNGAFKD